MKKGLIRLVSVLLAFAIILSVSAISGSALTFEQVQMPLPKVNEQLNVEASELFSSELFVKKNDSVSKEFAFSPLSNTVPEEDQSSALDGFNPELIHISENDQLISRSDNELAAVGAFSSASGYLIDSSGHRTDIWVETSGNTLTLSGSGIVPSSAFADADYYFANNTYNLIIKGNVTLSVASFYNLYNLRSVSFQGTLSDLPDNAFYACRSLVSIELPAAITHIGMGVFSECSSLTDVTIHSSSANIDDGAFFDLDSLQRISMPNGVSRIGYAAFYSCDHLTSVSVPAGLTEIGDYAFSGCSSLKTVTLPDSLETVGSGAFGACSALENVDMPSAKTFGSSVFEMCTELKSFTMPTNLESTGGFTFNACEKLESIVFSDKLTIISDRDFFECFSLKQVQLPVSLTTIGNAAFYNCQSLEEIEFPDNYIMVYAYAFSFCNQVEMIDNAVKLSSVGNEAFINTNFLKNVEFSPDTSYIGIGAFQNNLNLKSVDFNGAKIQFDDHSFYGCQNLNSIIDQPEFAYVGPMAFLQCPGITEVKLSSDCQGIYEGAFYSCENLRTVDFNGVETAIGHHAFAQCKNMVTVSNEQGITSLADYAFGACERLSDASGFTGVITLDEGAFWGCTALKTASVGEGLKEIGARAYQGCDNLSGFVFPECLETIGDYAFACSGLSGSISLPADVETIGIGAFGECRHISNVTLSANVTKLEDYVFLNSDKLTTVNCAGGVAEIGYGAFANCTSLTTVTFDSPLKKIGEYAFEGCEQLRGIGNHTAVTSIGSGAFHLCKRIKSMNMSEISYIGQNAFCQSGIESVLISSDMEFLGDDAFESCESLRTVKITGTLEKIGDEAFALCTSITTAELPAGLEFIGNLAFYGCDSIHQIDLPDSVKEIGNAAFYQCSALNSIVLPNTVENVGYSCFKGCTALESVTLSENLSFLDTAVFYGCSSLTEIEIPQCVKEIGFAAFAECDNLEEISLAEGLLSIGQYAFWNCKRLKSFDSPSTLQSVGDCAFADCEALTEIALPTKVSVISNYVFYQCKNLEAVYLSGSMIGFGISSFYQCEKLSDVYLYNGIPAYISEYAFFGTGQSLKLHYNSHVEGWSQPQWKGPDDKYYLTEAIAPDLDGTLAGSLTWTYHSEGGTLVISGNGSIDDFDNSFSLPWYPFLQEITAVIIENGVTSVGSRAFADCTMLRNVTMADTVTAIGDYAFANCDSLVYCRLSSQIKTIGSYAFYLCGNLDIDLTLKTETIGNYAFYGCTSVSTLNLPDSLKDIGEGAFYQCAGLTDVVLPKSMNELKDYTFRGCTSLKSVIIPASVTTIGRYSLGNCDNLDSVIIYGSPSIEDYAFAYSKKLSNLRFFGEGPHSIGYGAFKDLPDDATAYNIQSWVTDELSAKDGRTLPCAADSAQESGSYNSVQWKFYPETGLLLIQGLGAMSWSSSIQAPWSGCQADIRMVLMDSGVTSIGPNAFKNCTRLNKAVISDTVTSIGENAFAGCTSLKEITVPKNTTSLGNKVFEGCTSLAYVMLPDKVTVIPDYAFTCCDSLQSIISGNSVTKIGYSAFYGCELLDSFTFTGSTVTVGDWAFARCGNLNTVNGSQKVNVIGKASFFGCESMESFVLRNTISSVPDYAFAGTSLTEIALPSSVKTIGEKAFWGSALASINLDHVNSIGEAAFFESNLKNVTIPANLTTIGKMAFAGCRSLYSFTVNSSNSSYRAKDGNLYNKSGDTLVQYSIAKTDETIVVDSHVRNIGKGAFYGSKAVSIEMPDTIESIGEIAFAESGALTSIILPNALTQIEESSFANCKALKRVYVRENMTSIGANAFRGCENLILVCFDGNAPQTIGKDAFNDTDAELKFVYCSGRSGWTAGMWKAPDGLYYITKSENTDHFVNSVALELNGGTIYSGLISRYLYGEGALLPTDVQKNNCEFAGWYENSDFSGDPVLKIPADAVGDKTYYAKWDGGDIDVSVLKYFSQTYDTAGQKLNIIFKLSAADLPESGFTLLAAAYNGKKLAATSTANISASAANNAYYAVTASGDITTNTVFKVMLLSQTTHAPLTENLTIESGYALSGNGCSLSITPYTGSTESEENPNDVRPLDDDDNPNPDIDPGDEGEVPPKIDENEEDSLIDPSSNGSDRSEDLAVTITLSDEDLQKLLLNADKGKAGGLDLDLTLTYADDTANEELTSDISCSVFDASFGYRASDAFSDDETAYTAADHWLVMNYDSTRIASKSRAVSESQTGVQTALREEVGYDSLKAVSFNRDGEQILRLRGSGYINVGKDTALIYTGKNRYTLILPYYGLSNIVDINAKVLLNAITTSKAAANWSTVNPESATISFVIGDSDYAKLRFEYDETGSATHAELLAFHPIGNAVQDGTYNPIAIDETYEPSESMPLTVEGVSPSKGSNGQVTVKIIGSMMEASAKPRLVLGSTVIDAEKTYWFTHDRMYATFDLTNAADGVYALHLNQKDNTITLENCFTVDSSLPKGELSPQINVDKNAAVGEEFNGSVTFTNIGYTDVYAPVVYIDTANMEIREDENTKAFTNQSVFVCNVEGLTGIVANGETAAYNFLYKIKTNEGFTFNLYNYSDINGEIKDAVVLNEESTPGEYLNANLQALTGIRAPEYAESIAKMACQLSSLGDKDLDLSYLEKAYLADAQGILIGDSLVDAVDILSRDLSLSRYYTNNVMTRQKEGLFGKGWFSDLDTFAFYNYDEEDDFESVTVNTPFGITVYTEEDGVLKESIYGQSTAEYNGSVITIREADGSYTEYSSDGNPLRTVDALGDYTEIVYNENDKPVEMRNNQGDSLIFEYSDDKLTRISSSVTNDEVLYSYDSKGRLSAVNTMNGSTVYAYENNALINTDCLTSVISDSGVRQTIVYDDMGRIIELSYDETHVMYSYEGVNTVRTTDSYGTVTTQYYNAAGNLARAVGDDGSSAEVEYGSHMMSKGITSGLFNTSSISYDDSYNVTSVTDAENSSVDFIYDSLGNITSITDRGGKTTEYHRNAKGDTTEIVYPDGGKELFAYDDKGNMLSETKRDDSTINYTYNELSYPILVEYSTGDKVAYTYDSHGNRTEINENGQHTYMIYNAKDELTQVRYPGGTFVSYSYDTHGNLAEEKSYDGKVTMSYKYEYDKYNRLTKVFIGDDDLAVYTYNDDGSLQKQTNYNGTYTEYTYDKKGTLSAIYNRSKDGGLNSFFEYTYDDNGNIASMKEKEGTWTYGYDALGQMTKAVAPNGETTLYSYDYSGNRTSVTTGGTTVNYNSNEMNQYTVVGSTTLSYNDNGNLIASTDTEGTTSYEYDYADRLTKVTEPNGRVTRYGYDAFGLRMGKGVTEPGEQNEVITNYLNSPLGDGYTLVENTGKQYSYYFHGNGLAARVEHNCDETSYTAYNYSFNHLGSTTEITGEDGSVVNSYSYNQDGKVVSSVEGLFNNLTYVGAYGITDEKNGLYYDRVRHVSASTMSFTSPDPVGQISDLNLYRYVNNNPIRNIDITGNDWLDSNSRYRQYSIFNSSYDANNKVQSISSGNESSLFGNNSNPKNNADIFEKSSRKVTVKGKEYRLRRTLPYSNSKILRGSVKEGLFTKTVKAITKFFAKKGAKKAFVNGTGLVIAVAASPAVAVTVLTLVTVYNAVDTAVDVYHGSKWIYDNREKISNWYNDLKGATGDAVKAIQKRIDDRNTMYLSDYSGSTMLLKGHVEEKVTNPNTTDVYEYPSYYGNSFYPDTGTTVLYGYTGMEVFKDNIYSTTLYGGLSITDSVSAGNFTIGTIAPKANLTEGYNNYINGMKEKYGDEYVDPLVPASTDKGMMYTYNPTPNIGRIWVDITFADLVAMGRIGF